ncbi:hypothetical protein ADICYQ_3439 [Cyclobacterium qasimii M12-11B]|uniref:Uncharacterized protein n=1 Tax=Cyclobacterium qasimii M12-11B TaxID=641524 RepID=S7VB03_9BACT|nr:hypothetical protein ADICYQ_3439 [Cyclobacterium qasimii M12-11B]
MSSLKDHHFSRLATKNHISTKANIPNNRELYFLFIPIDQNP